MFLYTINIVFGAFEVPPEIYESSISGNINSFLGYPFPVI